MQPSPFHQAVWRALGLFDLNPLSRTRGCGDRNYWHYQDGKGFPVGSFQSAMAVFAAASRSGIPHQATLELAAELSSEFWSRQIVRRGSLDEYFPNQGSFCATAHTTLSAQMLSTIWHEEGKAVPPILSTAIEKALNGLADQKFRPDSANQTLAARLAWDLAGRRENPFVPRESSEGWLSEYGGFDLGYSLVCLDICALAAGLLGDPQRVLYYENLAASILNFLYFICVEHTFAPLLSSRGNPHRLLGGLMLFANTGDERAKACLEQISAMPDLVSASQSDDKYLVFFHLQSLWLEQQAASSSHSFFLRAIRKLPSTRRISSGRELKEARLVFQRSDRLRVAISLGQSGAVCLRGASAARASGGYAFRYRGKLWSTETMVSSVRLGEWTEIDISLVAKPVSERAKTVQSLPVRLGIAFLLSFWPTRKILNRWILARVTSRRQKTIPFGTRKIVVRGEQVEVVDTFRLAMRDLYAIENWSMTDGHSTRLSSGGREPLSRVGSVEVGTERHRTWVSSQGDWVENLSARRLGKTA